MLDWQLVEILFIWFIYLFYFKFGYDFSWTSIILICFKYIKIDSKDIYNMTFEVTGEIELNYIKIIQI